MGNRRRVLSGNVTEKLATARIFAENRPEFAINVTALAGVQPKELDASEIEVRIGATWIEPKYIEDFMRKPLKHRITSLTATLSGCSIPM